MANPDLLKYVTAARAQGTADDAIKTALMGSGWAESDVLAVLGPTTVTPLVPPPPPHSNMWVTFQYILAFITLYVTAVSLGGMLYYMADKIFPDAATASVIYNTIDTYLLKGYIAALIVAFPIFAILFVMVKKEFMAHPEIAGIRSRKVLFYITLVVTFIIMISQVIGVIYDLLGGAVTGQVVSHFIITIIIAGSIFLYLLRSVKTDRQKS